MDTSAFPTRVTRDGKIVIDTDVHTETDQPIGIHEYVPKMDYFISALTAMESEVLRCTEPVGLRRFSWILLARVYFYTILSFVQMETRFRVRTLSKEQQYRLTSFRKVYQSDTCSLPRTLAAEMQRISLIHHDPQGNVRSVPFLRSGLYVSPAIASDNGRPNIRHVHITEEYSQIPCVRVLVNFLYLSKNRHLLHSCVQFNRAIISFLLTGETEGPDLIINGNTLSDEDVLLWIFNNPVFARIPTASGMDYKIGYAELDDDFIPAPIKPGVNDIVCIDHVPIWLEPYPDPVVFERIKYLTGTYAAITNEVDCFDEMEFYTDRDTVYDDTFLAREFGSPPTPVDPTPDPGHWLHLLLP